MEQPGREAPQKKMKKQWKMGERRARKPTELAKATTVYDHEKKSIKRWAARTTQTTVRDTKT